jgi:hypothetical protein
MRSGRMEVVRTHELFFEESCMVRCVSPILGVACEVSGYSLELTHSVWGAAKILGLSNEFTTLVVLASSNNDRLFGKVLEVREELSANLKPEIYEPSLNSLRVPIIGSVR